MNELQQKIAALKSRGWLTSQIAAYAGTHAATIARWADGGNYGDAALRMIDAVAEFDCPAPAKKGRPLGGKNKPKKKAKK